MLDPHFDELVDLYQFTRLPREHKYFTTGNYLRANGARAWARIDLRELLTNGHRLLLRTGLEVQPHDDKFWVLLNDLRGVLAVYQRTNADVEGARFFDDVRFVHENFDHSRTRVPASLTSLNSGHDFVCKGNILLNSLNRFCMRVSPPRIIIFATVIL